MVRQELDIKSSLAHDHKDVRKCLNYLAIGRLKAKGLLSDIIPLGDLVEKGFNRLLVGKNLIEVVVAPYSGQPTNSGATPVRIPDG